MAIFRKLLFWTHLITGSLAGIVILIMSLTGVLLTYEKQMISWSDREYRVSLPSPNASPLPAGALVAKVLASGKEQPEGITWESDPEAPVALSYGRDTVYANPYTGEILGAPTTGMRAFMSSMREWHRWLAASGESRATGRAITGASNVVFLFLVVSGLYLWMPRQWSWKHLKPIVLFRGGLSGKARDFNWHNVAGFWTAIPLFFVVLSAMVISYPWFSQLVIRLADGETAASSAGPGGPRGAGPGGPRGGGPGGRDGGPGAERPAAVPVDPAALDAAYAKVLQEPDWKTIAFRLPHNPKQPLTALVSRGTGGQPQLRDTLSIALTTASPASAEAAAVAATATVVERETFESQSLGRRVRSWMRFVHTGEYYGLTGQTIAGIASAAGVLLVYSGFALALRRFWAWRKRRAAAAVRESAQTVEA